MKPIAMTLAGAALTGIITIEIWHLSGQRFWLFCALLLLVSESVFLGAKLLGDSDATKVLGWQFFGFLDWVTAWIFVAAIILSLIAFSVLIYQLVSFGPGGPCGAICLP